MSKQTGFLFVLLVALTALVAWEAREPNLYTHGPNASAGDTPYYWVYPLWMFAYGAIVIGLLSLKRPLLRFVGASVSFALSAALLVLFGMTAMHSAPAHDTLIYILFFTSLGLLFYAGFCCARYCSQAS